jgi:CrcB protein
MPRDRLDVAGIGDHGGHAAERFKLIHGETSAEGLPSGRSILSRWTIARQVRSIERPAIRRETGEMHRMGEGVAARILFLSLGGILGVNARYWLGEWITLRLGPRFPWGTFFANASGAFLIGALAVLLARWLPHTHARLFVITGFLGGYTTFSSYTFEALNLWERGEPGRAMVYREPGRGSGRGRTRGGHRAGVDRGDGTSGSNPRPRDRRAVPGNPVRRVANPVKLSRSRLSARVPRPDHSPGRIIGP